MSILKHKCTFTLYLLYSLQVLGYDLLDICLNQPEKLSTTAFSQPAILVATLATVERARCAERGQTSFPPSTGVNIGAMTHAVGSSLGETRHWSSPVRLLLRIASG